MKRLFAHFPTFGRLPGRVWRLAGRCFSLRVVILSCLVTAVVAFYTVELRRWQGQWKDYRTRALASGKRLDLAAFVTPPVPDAENFAAIPLFEDFYRDPNSSDGMDVPAAMDVFSGFSKGVRSAGFVGLAVFLENLTAFEKNPPAQEAGSPAQSRELLLKGLAFQDRYFGPVWRQLQQAAPRPLCQFPASRDISATGPRWPVLRLRKAAQWTGLRLQLHARLGDGPAALEDLRVMLRLADSLEAEPALVCAMMRVALAHFAMDGVWAGLNTGIWDDAALREIDARLARLDLLATCRFGWESERARVNGIFPLFFTQGVVSVFFNSAGKPCFDPWQLYPNGWVYRNQLLVNGYFDALLESIDLSRGTMDPQAPAATAIQEQNSSTISVRNRFFLIAAPNHVRSGQRTVLTEATVRQARTAVALQRYRLVHGEYPEALSALISEHLLPGLPRDPVSNAPMEYERLAVGGYSLKAVETDRVNGDVSGEAPHAWQPEPTLPAR